MQLKKKIGIAVLILLCSGLVGYPVFAEENQINKDSSDEVVITGTMDIESSDETDNMWESEQGDMSENSTIDNAEKDGVGKDSYFETDSSIGVDDVIIHQNMWDGEKYPNKAVFDFVIRLYNCVLERDGDEQGIYNWYTELVQQNITGIDAAEGFVLSQEFVEKKFK